MAQPGVCPFRHLLILDFETTCDEKCYDYAFEVIQFSVVVLEVSTNTINDRIYFNQIVRPTINPVLSECCKRITGISQEDVNSAQPFNDVYNLFYNWLLVNNFRESQFAIVCDTRQDLWRIAQYQFRLVHRTLPAFFRVYINLWRKFREVHPEHALDDPRREKTVMSRMATFYNVIQFLPSHNAINDCRTLARVAQAMLADGMVLTINETLVCSVFWRRTPLDFDPEWRTNFTEAQRVYERILPLATRPVRIWNPENYGFCADCGSPPIYCINFHKQPPRNLYASQGVIRFARAANYY